MDAFNILLGVMKLHENIDNIQINKIITKVARVNKQKVHQDLQWMRQNAAGKIYVRICAFAHRVSLTHSCSCGN